MKKSLWDIPYIHAIFVCAIVLGYYLLCMTVVPWLLSVFP